MQSFAARGCRLSCNQLQHSAPKLCQQLPAEHNLVGRGAKLALMEHSPGASLFDIMEDCKRRIIGDTLEKCGLNKAAAADHLDAEPEDQAVEYRD